MVKKNIKINNVIFIFKILFYFSVFNSGLHAKDQSLKFEFSSLKNKKLWMSFNNKGIINQNNTFNLIWSSKPNSKLYYQISTSNGFSIKPKLGLGESFVRYKPSKNYHITLGKYFREFSQYLNDDLTSGSLIISNNAQAIPRIGISGVRNFNKIINSELNWGLSHGFLKKNKFYLDGPFIHEKFIYLNFGKSKQVNYGIGIVHAAIWAGTTIDTIHNNNPGNQPDSFKDFLKVIIAADGPKLEGEPHANALGSHNGIWDFYVAKKFKKRDIKLYYQHYFEDTSSLRFANKTDGLWGIELINKTKKNNYLFEFINTTNCCIDPPYQNDIYYWNYQYNNGWKYIDMNIGNPFINAEEIIEKSKIVNFGFLKDFNGDTFKLSVFRKINVYDIIKYNLKYSHNIEKISVSIILIGDENDLESGLSLSYAF